MCIFNSEEVGSLTKEGADSSFLMDTLKRISKNIDIKRKIILYLSKFHFYNCLSILAKLYKKKK